MERLVVISDLKEYGYYFSQPDFSSPASKKDFEKLFGKESVLVIEGNSEATLSSKIISITVKNVELATKNKKIIHQLRMIFEHLISPEEYSDTEIAKRISQFLSQSPELRNEDVYHLLRFMVTGYKSGPSIGKGCVVLGRDKVIKRLSLFSCF